MKVNGHFLDVAEQIPSPNHYDSEMTPTIIVMHYTAGGSAEGSVSWLTDPESGVSAHIVIGRDGKVYQLVPFNRGAKHAGRSKYKGRSGANHFSIGIELDNGGLLKQLSMNNFCIEWTFKKKKPVRISPNDVIRIGGKIWHDYTPEQLDAAQEVCEALIKEYPSIKDIVGHEDVAPGRKIDPGPAFPMRAFKAAVLDPRGGNEAEVEEPKSETNSEEPDGKSKYPMTEKNQKWLDHWHYHATDPEDQGPRFKAINESTKHAAEVIMRCSPPGPRQTKALRALETARMWANSAIAVDEAAGEPI